MRICKICGLLADEHDDICVTCGTALEEMEYRWWQAEKSAYRKKYGVLPELNFCGQEGFELIQAPPVQHSELARRSVLKISNLLTGGLLGRQGVKNMLKSAGKAMKGAISIANGDVSMGLRELLDDAVNIYTEPIKRLTNDKEILKFITSFEDDVWARLYFLKNFIPVSTSYGDEYYVGMNGSYNGFKVYKDGTYFEGKFTNHMPSIGVEIKPTGEKFIGNYVTGEKHAGITLYTDNSYYCGTYEDGYHNGEGAYMSKQYFYSGGWNRGYRNGEGMLKKDNGECLIGKWQNDSFVK